MAREYPSQPVVGVGAVVVRGDRVLIVRRAHEPRKGQWSLPGGLLELGESLDEAVRREVMEETGLEVAVGPVVEPIERIHRDPDGRVRFHFVIVDFACRSDTGTAVAGSDAEAVAWAGLDELAAYEVDPHAAAVIARGLELLERQSERATATGC